MNDVQHFQRPCRFVYYCDPRNRCGIFLHSFCQRLCVLVPVCSLRIISRASVSRLIPPPAQVPAQRRLPAAASRPIRERRGRVCVVALVVNSFRQLGMGASASIGGPWCGFQVAGVAMCGRAGVRHTFGAELRPAGAQRAQRGVEWLVTAVVQRWPRRDSCDNG